MEEVFNVFIVPLVILVLILHMIFMDRFLGGGRFWEQTIDDQKPTKHCNGDKYPQCDQRKSFPVHRNNFV